MTGHKIEDCPQNPVLISINKTIDRWDKRMDRQDELMDRQDELMERQAVAMENIAAQGATLVSHGQLIEKNTKDISAAWKVIRVLELRHAEEDGADEVKEKIEERQQKFWDGVKQQVTSRALMGLLFLVWINDKYKFTQKLTALLKEFKLQ